MYLQEPPRGDGASSSVNFLPTTNGLQNRAPTFPLFFFFFFFFQFRFQ